MLDEFAALGRLDFFESQLGFMAGYGIRSFLITQSLNQLERAYGQNHAILDNCHVRIAFSTNDERTARRVSDALGTTTELRAMKTYSGNRLSLWLSHLVVSRQETSRQLLTPGEIMQLPPDEAIVMVSGLQPIRAGKARYYTDPEFKRRIVEPSGPAPSGLAARPDDWSLRPPIPPSADLLAMRNPRARDSNSQVRREPQLTHPIPGEPFDNELVATADGGGADAMRLRASARAVEGRAPSFGRDPDDWMGS